MEEDGGALAQANSSFARKLGSADKKTRDKGLALLVLWLSCQQVSYLGSLLSHHLGYGSAFVIMK